MLVITWAKLHPVLVAVLALLLVVVAMWAVKLAQVARSIDARAEYWSTPRGEPGGLLYVALGDSAAQGIGASGPDRGYVSLIAQRLRVASKQPVEVVNLSRSGARISDVLSRQIPALEALGRRPDLITVRGHVKVPAGGHEKSPRVASGSPHLVTVVSAGS